LHSLGVHTTSGQAVRWLSSTRATMRSGPGQSQQPAKVVMAQSSSPMQLGMSSGKSAARIGPGGAGWQAASSRTNSVVLTSRSYA
jgi:hypothetical protein